MANKTVSELNAATTVANNDVLLVETSTETKKVTKENLLKEVNNSLSSTDAKVTTLEEKVNENHTELTRKLEETNTQLSETKRELSSQLEHIENIVENRLNVRFFNVLGDGTDETEKIKQVFEFCKDKGYTVFFPKGTYLVSETITLQTSIIGKDATIYCNDIRVVEDNILIENLDIVSNLKTNGNDMYNSVELLKISNNNNTTIKNCMMSFNSDEKYGLSIKVTNSKNVIIDSCKFNGAGINISNKSTFKISNCDFDLRFINEQEAIHITAHSTGTITNNNFKNSNMDFIDLFSSGFNCIISNNKFENCKGGCMIETKVHLRDKDQPGGSSDELGFCRKNIITNNQFINLIADNSSRKSFINCVLIDTRNNKIDNIDNYGGDHIISNNIFEGCIDNSDSGYCVFTGINASSTRNLIVTSNIFKIYEKEGINSYNTCAIDIGNTRTDLGYVKSKNITFSDNIIFGNSCGILIGDSENVTINNNKYAFSSIDTTMRRFINLYNNPTNLTISNNIYEVEGQYFIYGIPSNLKTIESVNINANKTKSSIHLECSSTEDIQVINNMLKTVSIYDSNRTIISDNIFCEDVYYPIILNNAIQNTIISKNISTTPKQSILCSNCNIDNLLVVNNLNTHGKTIRLLNPIVTSKQPILVSNIVNGVINDQIG